MYFSLFLSFPRLFLSISFNKRSFVGKVNSDDGIEAATAPGIGEHTEFGFAISGFLKIRSYTMLLIINRRIQSLEKKFKHFSKKAGATRSAFSR